MKTVTSILLFSLCVMSSAAAEIVVKTERSTDSSSVQEPVIQSENRTDDEATCPMGWERYDKRCFKFSNIKQTWAEAERSCLLQGGNLASVHSPAEYTFIQGLIVSHTNGSPRTWIGGSDAEQEGIWFWSDGSRLAFSYWLKGEPNNVDGNEHCLEMNFGDGLLWNDQACSDTFISVCAKRLISS